MFPSWFLFLCKPDRNERNIWAGTGKTLRGSQYFIFQKVKLSVENWRALEFLAFRAKVQFFFTSFSPGVFRFLSDSSEAVHDFISSPLSQRSSGPAVLCICRSWRGHYKENTSGARKAAEGRFCHSHFLQLSQSGARGKVLPFGVQQMTGTPGPAVAPTPSTQPDSSVATLLWLWHRYILA